MDSFPGSAFHNYSARSESPGQTPDTPKLESSTHLKQTTYPPASHSHSYDSSVPTTVPNGISEAYVSHHPLRNASTASLVTSSTNSSTPTSSAPMTPLRSLQRFPQHIYRVPGLLAPINGSPTSKSHLPLTSKDETVSQSSGADTQSREAQTKNRLAMFLAANGVGVYSYNSASNQPTNVSI